MPFEVNAMASELVDFSAADETLAAAQCLHHFLLFLEFGKSVNDDSAEDTQHDSGDDEEVGESQDETVDEVVVLEVEVSGLI